mmetsp:Transcript_41577/g.74919  ORF Transcript_41577/g.74919 Transcript_41577/m.74919 type:complete len:90 (+) Transcript_41577:124-393(+)
MACSETISLPDIRALVVVLTLVVKTITAAITLVVTTIPVALMVMVMNEAKRRSVYERYSETDSNVNVRIIEKKRTMEESVTVKTIKSRR